jgi:hypothetical protein
MFVKTKLEVDNMNMFDISFDCDFVQARYVSFQQGSKNSSICYELKPGSIDVATLETGDPKRETERKSGPKGSAGAQF